MPDAALSNRERAEALVGAVLDAEAKYLQAVDEYEEARALANAAGDRYAEAVDALDRARREAAEVMGLD